MKVTTSVLLFSLSFATGALRDAGISPKEEHGPLETVTVPDEDPDRLLSDSDSSSVLYQADPKFTRVQLVGAHTKWLFCSSTPFLGPETPCETRQRFVPYGYWFETGRFFTDKTDCSGVTEDDVPIVTCSFKRGLKMVLPVVNYIATSCNSTRVRLDPKVAVLDVLDNLVGQTIIKATLDGVNVPRVDAIPVVTQDGDADYKLPGPTGCFDVLDGLLAKDQGCELLASGQYLFIDTKNLTKGKHELLMIGEYTLPSGGCVGVKHKFRLY